MDRYEIFKQKVSVGVKVVATPKGDNIKSELQDQWYWRLVAKNNKIVAQSEGYNRRSQAIAAAERLPAIAATTAIVENLGRGE